jgi:hypothetical protein
MIQAPLGCGGQVGLHDGEVGQSLQGAPATAGGPLLDFDGSDVSFCLVVGVMPMSYLGLARPVRNEDEWSFRWVACPWRTDYLWFLWYGV